MWPAVRLELRPWAGTGADSEEAFLTTSSWGSAHSARPGQLSLPRFNGRSGREEGSTPGLHPRRPPHPIPLSSLVDCKARAVPLRQRFYRALKRVGVRGALAYTTSVRANPRRTAGARPPTRVDVGEAWYQHCQTSLCTCLFVETRGDGLAWWMFISATLWASCRRASNTCLREADKGSTDRSDWANSKNPRRATHELCSNAVSHLYSVSGLSHPCWLGVEKIWKEHNRSGTIGSMFINVEKKKKHFPGCSTLLGFTGWKSSTDNKPETNLCFQPKWCLIKQKQ